MDVKSTELATTTEALHKAACSYLISTRQAGRSVVEQGAQEDTPTGKTPRKRVWEHASEWALTEDRDVVIKSWRTKCVSALDNNIFLAECLPPPKEDGRDDEVVPLPDSESEPPKSGEPEVSSGSNSPMTVSMASSSSSSVSIPLPTRPAPEYKKIRAGRGFPTMGALTERTTNIAVTRGPRRAKSLSSRWINIMYALFVDLLSVVVGHESQHSQTLLANPLTKW